jgi:hypothetical protein
MTSQKNTTSATQNIEKTDKLHLRQNLGRFLLGEGFGGGGAFLTVHRSSKWSSGTKGESRIF